MPYIKQEDRNDLIEAYSERERNAENPGELNYQFTKHILEYIRTHKISYQTINDVIGALEGAKLEFYRRVVVPYEEQKIKENGDVY